MPQNSDAGEVEVMGLARMAFPVSDVCLYRSRTATHAYVIGAMNLLASIPPNVISPFWDVSDVGGANARATRSAGMTRALNRLSVTTKNVALVTLLRCIVGRYGDTRRNQGPAIHAARP